MRAIAVDTSGSGLTYQSDIFFMNYYTTDLSNNGKLYKDMYGVVNYSLPTAIVFLIQDKLTDVNNTPRTFTINTEFETAVPASFLVLETELSGDVAAFTVEIRTRGIKLTLDLSTTMWTWS